MTIDFKGSHYPKNVIMYAVFFYVRYAVSYRDQFNLAWALFIEDLSGSGLVTSFTQRGYILPMLVHIHFKEEEELGF